MKKILLVNFILLIVFVLFACAGDTTGLVLAPEYTLTEQETTEDLNDILEVFVSEEKIVEGLYTDTESEIVEGPCAAAEDYLTTEGIILGDVFFDDIPICQLFLEPFAEVLGSTISDHLPFFSYDGISIGAASCLEMASQISADKKRLRVNEIALANITTQDDLIVALGESLTYYEYSDGSVFRHDERNRSMRYHVSNPAIEYILTFRFEDPDDRAIITSVSINRMPSCITRN